MKWLINIEGSEVGIENQFLLQDVYETVFGIFNHLSNVKGLKRPMASTGYHPGEDYTEHSVMGEVMDIYHDLNIGTVFNISFLDYLKLPIGTFELMTKKAKQYKTKSVNDNNNNVNEAEKVLKESMRASTNRKR